MRQIEGESYLNFEEIEEQYGWKAGTVYYFRDKGLLEIYGNLPGDRRSYAKVSELETIKNRPPEIKKRGPKENRQESLVNPLAV